MPGFLLHMGATVTCAHGGQATPTMPYTRVMVGGQPIITLPTMYAVAGCAFPPPPVASGPCVTANFVIGSTRILAGGTPVLLSDGQAVCVPTGTPLIVAVTQTRVKGM